MKNFNRAQYNFSESGGKKNALRYDITPYNYLYDGHLMTKTVGKSKLLEELEQCLSTVDYNKEIPSDVSLLIDFISFARFIVK